MKYIIGLSIVIIVIFISTKKESIITTKLQPTDSIIAFGDSLTYGYGADTKDSYPSILSKLSGHRVINAGLSGELSSQGLKRLPSILKDSDAKLMILCHGGNDILQRSSKKELKSNLKAMVKIAKDRGMQVLLVDVPDISMLGLSAPHLYAEVASQEKIPLADGILEDIISDDSLKSDYIHPNAKGYHILANEIYKKLIELEIL
ncbi:lipolytic enzyme, G-D-S-L [hydrothermal vent metagenome]|uniref:Lipolytic enzyme, G-D-S-L n=1 Tax=hydrothermal vent metagenome TaxID=652676 RepID=A0A1W1BVC7_9ZZZZ